MSRSSVLLRRVAVNRSYLAFYVRGRWRFMHFLPLLTDIAAWIVLGCLIYGAGWLFHAGWLAVRP